MPGYEEKSSQVNDCIGCSNVEKYAPGFGFGIVSLKTLNPLTVTLFFMPSL